MLEGTLSEGNTIIIIVSFSTRLKSKNKGPSRCNPYRFLSKNSKKFYIRRSEYTLIEDNDKVTRLSLNIEAAIDELQNLIMDKQKELNKLREIICNGILNDQITA